MIQVPLRVSLLGGGSDLPEFIRLEEGRVLSTTINRYVCVRGLYGGIHAPSIASVNLDAQHSPYLNALLAAAIDAIAAHFFLPPQQTHKNAHFVVASDVPVSSGLGAGSAIVVGLLRALLARMNATMRPQEIAELAFVVEQRIGHTGGKHDQYATALGGAYEFVFQPPGGTVLAHHWGLAGAIAGHALLVHVPRTELSAATLLTAVANTMADRTAHVRDAIRATMALIPAARTAGSEGNIKRLGELVLEGWNLKRTYTKTQPQVDAIIATALRCGAWGARLCGAGAGGHILIIAPPSTHHSIARQLSEHGVTPLRVAL